jgi:AcrR family transcriptional regulator
MAGTERGSSALASTPRRRSVKPRASEQLQPGASEQQHAATGTVRRNGGDRGFEHGNDAEKHGSPVVDGVGRGDLVDIQRARMLTAMTEAAAERGAANVTVAHVVERAGVSRRTFYEIFKDAEECLLAAIDHATARLSERVLPAYQTNGRWRERIRAALSALLELFDEDPNLARLLIIETPAAGHQTLERRSRLLEHATAAIAQANSDTNTTTTPATTMAAAAIRLTAEGTVGAVLSLIHNRLLREHDEQPLIELMNPFMSIIVLPYLGANAARRELEHPVHKPPTRVKPTDSGNPLKELHMRLTYRTVSVLATVASHPGASNRMIADATGITDQGQVSKLLSRLQKLGLISNAGLGPGRGAPNEWTLTERGKEVSGALAGHL